MPCSNSDFGCRLCRLHSLCARALPPSPAFVAVYNAVSILNDLTTAIILFGQFNILRSRALLLLASGYLFASLISVVQLLTFPGMFADAGLLGAGSQTALWLCVLWHGGFPLVVISYALFQDSSRGIVAPPRIAIAWAVTAVVGVVLACWFAATWGTENARLLPPMLDRTGFTPWQRVVNLADILLVLVRLRLAGGAPSTQPAESMAYGRDGLLVLRHHAELVPERRSL